MLTFEITGNLSARLKKKIGGNFRGQHFARISRMVLGDCWSCDRKGIWPVKNWVLVCWR